MVCWLYSTGLWSITVPTYHIAEGVSLEGLCEDSVDDIFVFACIVVVRVAELSVLDEFMFWICRFYHTLHSVCLRRFMSNHINAYCVFRSPFLTEFLYFCTLTKENVLAVIDKCFS